MLSDVLGASAWICCAVAGLSAFSSVFELILRSTLRAGYKALAFVGVVAVWCAMQALALIIAFRLVYCESCAGKPMKTEDLVAFMVLIAPTLAMWAISAILHCRSKPIP